MLFAIGQPPNNCGFMLGREGEKLLIAKIIKDKEYEETKGFWQLGGSGGAYRKEQFHQYGGFKMACAYFIDNE